MNTYRYFWGYKLQYDLTGAAGRGGVHGGWRIYIILLRGMGWGLQFKEKETENSHCSFSAALPLYKFIIIKKSIAGEVEIIRELGKTEEISCQVVR